MKLRYYKYSLWIALLLFASKSRAQPIVLTPKWVAQAQFAGYYVAQEMGFYKAEGLNVRIEHTAISESSYSVLQKGKAQAVVMNLSFALTEQAAGAQIVNILQTSQENSLMLVSRVPLKGIASLQNKKIGVWSHLSQSLLRRLEGHYGLNVEWIRFNGGVNIFLSGAVDLCLVGSYNEYLQLEECGMKRESAYWMRFGDYGYNIPEDGLYVTQEFYRSHPDKVRKLIRASIRGWMWVHKHRERALDIVMEKVRCDNIGTNRYHQRRMLEEVLRLQKNRRNGKRTYHLSREDFNCAVDNLLSKEEKQKIQYVDFVK